MHLHGYSSNEYYGGNPHPSNGTKSPKTFKEFHFEDKLYNTIFATIPPYKNRGKSPSGHSNDKIVGSFPRENGLIISPRENEELSAFAKIEIEKA